MVPFTLSFNMNIHINATRKRNKEHTTNTEIRKIVDKKKQLFIDVTSIEMESTRHLKIE